MILFGNFLFPESTGNSVNIMYLPLLRNINKVSTYSWGSTVLAHLYSAMCKTAKKEYLYVFFMCIFAKSIGLIKNVVTRPDKRELIHVPVCNKVSVTLYHLINYILYYN